MPRQARLDLRGDHLERTLQDVGQDLHVGVAVRVEAGARLHAVVVEDAQGPNPTWSGSWYSPKENVCRLSSQSQSVRPRSSAGRTRIEAVPRPPPGSTRFPTL
jgi:hypothetical protein